MQDIVRDHTFSSLRIIAVILIISPEMIRLHLWRIDDVLKVLHWISHTHTEDLKRVRVEMFSAMLTAIQIQEDNQ
jgi:hypothetical protein